MTTAENILETVRLAGGYLWAADGGRLRYRLPPERSDLIPVLRELKSEILDLLSDRSPDAPEACREDFAGWIAANCLRREGRDDWGGIGALLVDFAEWCVTHNVIPCRRAAFERLLQDAGFRINEGMVGGLVLGADLWAVPPATAASVQPARRKRRAGGLQ
jgi:hypothetical protein